MSPPCGETTAALPETLPDGGMTAMLIVVEVNENERPQLLLDTALSYQILTKNWVLAQGEGRGNTMR